MDMLVQAQKEIRRHKNPVKAGFLKKFFKTGPGQYAQGDEFLGIAVPQTKLVAKKFSSLPLHSVFSLLESKYHEERLMALFILRQQYEKGSADVRKKIYSGYLRRIRKFVNNWDLVDSSAAQIIGRHLSGQSRDILYQLAQSGNLWERRVSVIATLDFIRHNEFQDTLNISEILLGDTHDLIHKATGWMLREVGKRDISVLQAFLKKHASRMPRTMLRYAIEKFPAQERKKYLSIKYESVV